MWCIQPDSWSSRLLMRCGLPDPPCPNTACYLCCSSSPTTSRFNSSATCFLMKVLLLPPSTRRSPFYLLCGVVITLAVLQRWLSSSRAAATWMLTFLRLLGGWWDSSISSGHSAWWCLSSLHCLQVKSRWVIVLGLVASSHAEFHISASRWKSFAFLPELAPWCRLWRSDPSHHRRSRFLVLIADPGCLGYAFL